MRVIEFSKLARSFVRLQIRSAYNGKILCKNFNPHKHTEIAQREIKSFETAIKVDSGYIARAYIEVWVEGKIEYDKEHKVEE